MDTRVSSYALTANLVRRPRKSHCLRTVDTQTCTRLQSKTSFFLLSMKKGTMHVSAVPELFSEKKSGTFESVRACRYKRKKSSEIVALANKNRMGPHTQKKNIRLSRKLSKMNVVQSECRGPATKARWHKQKSMRLPPKAMWRKTCPRLVRIESPLVNPFSLQINFILLSSHSLKREPGRQAFGNNTRSFQHSLIILNFETCSSSGNFCTC